MDTTQHTPRRRTSTAIQDRESIDSERLSSDVEADVLLSDTAVPEDRKRNVAPYRYLYKVLITVVIVSVFCIVAFSSLTAWREQLAFGPVTSQGVESDDQFLAKQLFPEEHIYREPKIQYHEWVVSSDIRAPDGVQKNVYLINNAFPGPTIEVRTGDTLIVSVTNALKEGLSMHWHGLHMRGANEMDGAVGFTQSPIPSGESFTYRFTIADQDGTFWYHAHSHVQRGDGLYGGLVVHKPVTTKGGTRNRQAPENEVLLLVGDWFHRSSETMLEWYTSVRGFGNEPVPDSLVINGAGSFDCSMAVPARPVECSPVKRSTPVFQNTKPVRVRLVNVGSIAGISIKLSNAKLAPLQIDSGFDITSEAADSLGILYPGERVDIAVQWDDDPADLSSELEITLDPENFKYSNPALTPIQSFAAIPVNTLRSSTTVANVPETNLEKVDFDLQNAKGLPTPVKISIPPTADQTVILYIKTLKLSKFANHPKGFINRTSWSPQETPLIHLPRSAWDVNQLVPYIPLHSSSDNQSRWVDVIINNLDDGSHPFHLHGHDFYVLESYKSENGWGSFKGTTFPPLFRSEGLLRKDTVSVPRRGYVVIRFRADNEGIWMFHCHVLVHLGSGMAMGFQVGGDKYREFQD